MKNIVTITPFGFLFGSSVSTIKSDDRNYNIERQSKKNTRSDFRERAVGNYKMKHLNKHNKSHISITPELAKDSAINQNGLFVFLARI